MTVNRDRKMIAVEYAELDLEYATLDEMIAQLQKYREEIAGDSYFSIRQCKHIDMVYPALMTTRMETDEEMAKRIAEEEHNEKREREEFERLARKFGKG